GQCPIPHAKIHLICVPSPPNPCYHIQTHIAQRRHTHDPHSLVETSHHLPNLSPQLPGQQRRRCRRPARHHQPPRLPGRPGHHGRVDFPHLPLPHGRLRLRCQQLHRHSPPLRHAGRHRHPHPRSTRPGPQSHP